MNTLVNVYDPLCGWCYGFGPVLVQLEKAYKGRLKFDVISGGMITGNRVGPLSNMAGFISQAYKTVEQHTGIKFGPGFIDKALKEGTATFSSLEPSKVLMVFRQFHPDKVVEFSHEIQKLIYFDGIDPVRYAAYLPLFEKYGVDTKKALELLATKQIEAETVGDFSQAQKWGVSGFPTCIMQTADGKAYGISSGYMAFKDLEKKIQPYLK